jgi:hypothetical protein
MQTTDWCKTCRRKHVHAETIVNYRHSKNIHAESTRVNMIFGGCIAAVGVTHSLVAAVDTHYLPKRLQNVSNDTTFMFRTIMQMRMSNRISACLFGIATLFFVKAWHHRSRYISYKNNLKKIMKTSCSNA